MNEPLKTFNFKSTFKRSSPGKFGGPTDYEQSVFEFKFYSDKIEIDRTTNRKFISGFRNVRRGFSPPFDKTFKSKNQYLINDIKDIKEFYGSLQFDLVDSNFETFSLSEDIIDKKFINEMKNVFIILKNNSIENNEEFSKLIISVNTRLKKELMNYEERKEDFIIGSNIYFEVLKNNQSKINEINREYLQKFVKLNNFLKQKSSNLSVIINKIIYNIENEPKELIIERQKEVNFFKGLVYSYNLIVNQSIIMLTSLVEDDTITFYETYEVFDKMNIFNTNWENEVNNKLSEINESLQDMNFSIRGLMNQMRSMERNIVNGLQSINTSIGSLETSVNKQLSETNSRLKYENLTNYYKKSTLQGSWDWFDGPTS